MVGIDLLTISIPGVNYPERGYSMRGNSRFEKGVMIILLGMVGFYACQKKELKEEARKVLEEALQEKNIYARLSAAEALAEMGETAKISIIREALKNPDGNVRGAAARAIARLKDRGSIEEVRELLKDDMPFTRVIAMEVLAELEDKQALPFLRERIRDKLSPIRKAAVEAIGAMKDKASMRELRTALRDKDPYVHYAAAAALAKLGDKSALQDLRKGLGSEDPGLQIYVIQALGDLKDEVSAPFLEERLESPRMDIRVYAAEALLKIDKEKYKEKAFPVLLQTFEIEDPLLRTSVIELMTQIEDPFFIKPLEERVKEDKYVNVRVAAVKALVRMRDTSLVDILSKYLKYPDPFMRIAAAWGIQKLKK